MQRFSREPVHQDDKVTKTESGELGSAVSAYIERIQSDRSIVPSFNTFYEYMRDDYRKESYTYSADIQPCSPMRGPSKPLPR